MSGNIGTDTLGAIAGKGRGTGRGKPQYNTSTQSTQHGTGRGTSVPPNLAHQYQPQQYNPVNPHYNYNYGIDNLLSQQTHQIPQQTRQQNVNPMHTSMVTTSQTTGKSATDSNKKIIELLVNIVNILDKHNETINRIDDRTKNMEQDIRDINNNLVTREYISEVLKSLSKLPEQDYKDEQFDDDDDKALDDAMNKLSNITNDNSVSNNDSN